MPQIVAEKAWDVTKGSSEVVVAVVGTGVDTTHADLTNKLVDRSAWYDFGNGDNDPTDTVGHGTHVAGIIAAEPNNGTGVAGLAWQTRILPVKVFAGNNDRTPSTVIARGVIHAVLQGADVINLSLGSEDAASVERDAIRFAHDHGVVVVAAAGNDNTDRRFYPASFDYVISVASTDSNDGKSGFSNFGSSVDISAPGDMILSTVPGGYAWISGTSMASPYVAAVAALLKAQKPEWKPEDIENRIRGTADNIDSVNPNFVGKLGAGRMNAFRAVEGNNPPPPPTPEPQPTEPPAPPPPPPPPLAHLVTVRVLRLQSKSSDACGAMDFYGSMELRRGAAAGRGFGVVDGNDIQPGWNVYGISDPNVATIDALIVIRDEDDFFCGGGDDDVDVNPDSRQKAVYIRANLATNEVWLLEPDGDTFQSVLGSIGSPIVLEGFEGQEVGILTLQVDIATEFNVIAQHSNKCLDVDFGRGSDDGANVQQWDCYGPEQTNQVWSLRQVGFHYQVVSKYSGKCLDVDLSQGYANNWTNIQQWECLGEGQTNQLWDLRRAGDWYDLVSVVSGKCADVAGMSLDNGGNIHQWDCYGGANQHWRLSR